MRVATIVLGLVIVGACGTDMVFIPARPLPGPGAPLGYEDGALAIDPATGDILYTGGGHEGIEELSYYGTTSRFVDDSWTIADETLPSRYGHSVVFDERRDTLVLFGGVGLCGDHESRVCCNETWEWDGVRWLKITVEGPGARAFASMVYDTVDERVLLFGGDLCGGEGGEKMWAYDGAAWSVVQ